MSLSMDIQYTAKKCSMVYTPVQRGEVCWFAALMMTIFFSQSMRAVSFQHAKKVASQGSWRAPIAEAMMLIMKNYELNSLDKSMVGKLEPRAFLKALRRYDPVYFDSATNEHIESDGASYGPYQHKLLAFLDIPHLSVTVPRGKTEAIYSAYNFDLPLDERKWEKAVETLDPKGAFVDTDNPEVIIIHREAGESYLQKAWKTYRPKMGTIRGLNLTRHPNSITYNSKKYVLDSCILPSHIAGCSMGHVLAGVTCNSGRYVYNGWAARSGDKAMQTPVTREMPCALMPSDWAKDKALCVNSKSCTMNEVSNKDKGKDFCFEAFKRSSVVYVREDMASRAGYRNENVLKKATPVIIKNTKKAMPVDNKSAKLELLKQRIKGMK
ncbi:hypothetical protein FR483_N465R [Paramecium bursaria Chlorella virus FR483]|uniref:Uncharacterized protein N465R n=1 Tax=Paramecium bursaria Chlorella virus FR483 TaxID=399781 RepID=A7J7G9_PBCVF|nr:hypothetical protein FR483_N465R [Paramecium bursaria Chlorella virus FR483]ABT15750.1 hypothetical protein FR483_N465R [Paramecium bursaria Chlorella virus FR483]